MKGKSITGRVFGASLRVLGDVLECCAVLMFGGDDNAYGSSVPVAFVEH